jgi:hypothetical protein
MVVDYGIDFSDPPSIENGKCCSIVENSKCQAFPSIGTGIDMGFVGNERFNINVKTCNSSEDAVCSRRNA